MANFEMHLSGKHAAVSFLTFQQNGCCPAGRFLILLILSSPFAVCLFKASLCFRLRDAAAHKLLGFFNEGAISHEKWGALMQVLGNDV